jgi:hypothetical protein
MSLEHEYRRALELGTTIRVLDARPPRRARALEPLVREAPHDPEALRTALLEARRAHREASRYDLVRNNCATAVIVTLAASLGGDTRALGAPLEPGAGLGFVPAGLLAEVRARLHVSRVERVASYRERRLAELAPGVRWREALTLTSRIYRPRHADTSFLLFTDDVRWRRPLYGVLNLGYGLGNAALGVATAPFDGGQRASRGALGALFSLPEIAGLSLRKGGFDLDRVE